MDLKIVTTSPRPEAEREKYEEARRDSTGTRNSASSDAPRGSGQSSTPGEDNAMWEGGGQSRAIAKKDTMTQVERKEEAGEKGEEVFELRNVDGRDQAFSQIVGFSQVRWVVIW